MSCVVVLCNKAHCRFSENDLCLSVSLGCLGIFTEHPQPAAQPNELSLTAGSLAWLQRLPIQQWPCTLHSEESSLGSPSWIPESFHCTGFSSPSCSPVTPHAPSILFILDLSLPCLPPPVPQSTRKIYSPSQGDPCIPPRALIFLPNFFGSVD